MGELPRDLRLQVDPSYPYLLDDVLVWIGERMGDGPGEHSPLKAQTDVRAALLRHGYEPQDESALPNHGK